MPDFHSLLNERMRIAWEDLAHRTNENLRQSQLQLGERGLRGSGFELKEFARIRAEAITERGAVVWQCIAETLAALDPPYSDSLSQRLHRFAESYFPDNQTEENRALQEEVTRLNFAPALAGMKYDIDTALHQARRVLMLKLDEEMLRRKLAAAAETTSETPANTSNPWSDAKKWTMGIVSALLVASVLGLVGYLSRKPVGVRDQDVSFTASTGTRFAIQSAFAGSAEVRGSELSVKVEHADISYVHAAPGGTGPRHVLELRVSLVEAHNGKPVRQSGVRKVDRELEVGQTVSMEPFVLGMSVAGLPSLSSLRLEFYVYEAIPGVAEPGLSVAPSRTGLFSD
jgi:hypothetical protein